MFRITVASMVVKNNIKQNVKIIKKIKKSSQWMQDTLHCVTACDVHMSVIQE